jgi:hypothetical protein
LIFCWDGLLTALTAIQFCAGTRNHPERGALKSDLTSADSGSSSWNLEIALSGVLATSNPAAYSAVPKIVENIGERNRAGFINFGKNCRALTSINRCRIMAYNAHDQPAALSLSATIFQYFIDGMMAESANPRTTLRSMTKGRFIASHAHQRWLVLSRWT